MSTAVAPNRKARRAQGIRSRTGVAAAAAMTTAAALTVGVGTPATFGPRVVTNPNILLAADPINIDLITTGPLLGLASLFGYDSIPLSIPNPVDPTQPPIVVNINLNHTNNLPQNVYDTINALPMEKAPYGPLDIFCSDNKNANGCRIAPIVTIGSGAQGLRAAMNSLWSIALGTNLQQYAPLKAGFTSTPAIVVNNPFRPNGGIDGRFGAALQNLGSVPADAPKDGTVIGNHLLDITWEYQPQADFPAVFNVFSLVNSFMGVLPPITDLLTTKPLDIVQKQIATTTNVGGQTYAPGSDETLQNLIAVLEWFSGAPKTPEMLDSVFATLVSGTLPIFEPNALGTYLTNSVLKRINSPFLFGDVISDLFTPAMKILVNIGYADVITPDMIKANPDLVTQGYAAYDRTFAQQQIDFGTVQPLTFQQQIQAYGDAFTAFTNSLKEQFAKPFFGIVVPNTIPGGTAATPAAAKPAPAAAAAVVEAPALSAPVVSAPAESPAPEAVSTPAPEPVSAPAPEADSVPSAPTAPTIDTDLLAAVPAPAEAPSPAAGAGHRGGSSAKAGGGSDTPGHRGSAHSAANSDN